MITNSIEENFGYCIAESIVYNTYPIAFNGLSHSEILENDNKFLWNDVDEIIPKMENLINENIDITSYAKKYENAIQKMIEYIK